jgi:uncharacterized protein YfaS (alpha-2-macroglobulin family)
MPKTLIAFFLALALALIGCDDQRPEPSAGLVPPATPQVAPQVIADSIQAAPKVTGELKILQFLPKGPVKSLNQIVVMLNQPMVALGSYDQTPKDFLVLDPPVPGQLRWLNEYTLGFTPDKPLSGSLTLKATLKPGLKALSGAVLAEGAETTITLPKIGVLSTNPETTIKPEEGYRPAWAVNFNQPLDLAVLRQKTSVVFNDPAGQEIKVGVKVTEAKGLDDLNPNQNYWSFHLQSDQILPMNTPYKLVAEPGLVSLVGPETSTQKLVILESNTPAPLEVTIQQSRAQPGQVFEINPDDFFSLGFNNPVNFRQILDFVEFSPPYPGLEYQKAAAKESTDGEEGDNYANNIEELSFWVPFRALTDYVVTIKAGATDIYGQSLAEDKTLNFRTKTFTPEAVWKLGDGFLETSSTAIIPVSITNKAEVLVKGYALDAAEAIEILEVIRPNIYVAEQERMVALDKMLAALPSKDATLKPPEAAKYGQILMGINLKELFGADLVGKTLFLTINEDNKTTDVNIYQISDLGLTAKIGWDDGLVWVNDLHQSQPLTGVELQLLGPGGRVYWTGVSDERGLAKLPGRQEILAQAPIRANAKYDYERTPALYLTASHQGQSGVWNVTAESFEYWRFNIDYKSIKSPFGPNNSLNWLLSAQPIYQPGETIKLKGLNRLLDGEKIAEPTGETTLAIYSPRGSLVKKDTVKLSELGTFYYEIDLPKPISLGTYSVFLIKDPNFNFSDQNIYYGQESDSYDRLGQFQVQNFRTPAFDLAYKPLAPAISGQKVSIAATATYHFGSPVIDNPADYDVSAMTEELTFPNLPGFQALDLFQSFTENCDECYQPPQTVVASGRTNLDKKGEVSFEVTIPPEKTPRPRKFLVNIAAQDVDSRVVSRPASFLAHPAELYVALKTPSALTQSGSSMSVDFAVVNLDGQFQAQREVEIQLFQRSWHTIRLREVGATYNYSSKKVDTLISTSQVKSGDKVTNFDVSVPKPGYYFVRAIIKDANNRPNQAAVGFYAFGPGPVGWDFQNNESLTIIPDKTVYQPGDTAQLLIQSPFQSGQGLLTVERAGVRQTQTFTLADQSPVLSVPLSQDDGPNVYVSVILTRGRISDKPDDQNVDLGKPTIRQGYLVLNVAGHPDLLTVNVKANQAEYRPRDKVTVEIEAKNAQGLPAQGEVALVVVDAGVVQVGGEAGYYPEKEFFKARPLLVSTFNNLAKLIGRRNWSLKGVEPGGGGGPIGQSQNLDLLRSDFQNLAHFEPFVQLDQNGRGTVTFSLPDNLTTFKVYAVATGKGRQIGTGLTEILVTKNFLLRPSLPAQASVGDEFTASVILTNRGPAGEAAVSIKTENLDILDAMVLKKVTIASGTSQEVGFRVKASQPGDAYLTFEASLGQENDATKSLTPIRYLSQLTTQTAFRELSPGTEEVALNPSQNLDPTRGGLTLAISPTLAPFLGAPWSYLATYPYQCLEQTTSKAFGALAMTRVKNWINSTPAEIQSLNDIIKSQLSLIQAREQNGGYSLWSDQKGWAHRDPGLSAYVLDFLLEAKKDGYPVPEDTLANTIRYVQSILTGEGIHWPSWQDKQTQQTLKTEAASVLARAGVSMENFLEFYFQNRANLNYFQLLSLTRGVNALPKNKARVDQLTILLGLIANQAHFGPGQVTIPSLWIDHKRLTALTLLTLAEVAPYNDLIPGLVRSLGDLSSSQGGLGSTQVNITALLALATYINKAETETPNLNIRAIIGDKELEPVNLDSFVNKPPAQSIPAEALAGIEKLKFFATGSGRAWASIRLSSAPKEPDLNPVIGNGLTVSRSYAVIKPEPLGVGQSVFQRGQVVKVTITFMTPVERYNLILEDRLPAGFEAINFSLKDADQTLIPLLSADDDSNSPSWRKYWREHEEFWPDRVQASTRYLPAGVYTYTYLIRPATPGKYVVPGPKVEEMYSPETFGLGAGQIISVE